MQEPFKLPPANQSRFSEAEIKTFNEHFDLQYGSRAKAITLSGLHKQTWWRAMRGEPVKTENLRKISSANYQTITVIQKKLKAVAKCKQQDNQ